MPSKRVEDAIDPASRDDSRIYWTHHGKHRTPNVYLPHWQADERVDHADQPPRAHVDAAYPRHRISPIQVQDGLNKIPVE